MENLTTRDGRRLAYRRLGEGPVLICHPGGPGRPAVHARGPGRRRSGPKRLVVLGSVGHFQWFEDPARFRRGVLDFLT